MGLVNVTEALVRGLLDDAYLKTDRLVCHCDQCVDDILALTLNRLTNRFVSTNQGNAFVKAQYFDVQMQMDVFRELALSVEIVSKNPRHELPANHA